MDKDPKSLFKVYHYIYNKQYDYDSEEGIKRYNIFKENVEKIKQHNMSKSTYKKGVNRLTDLTVAEARAHYNLKPIKISEFKRMLRGLGALDDFADEQEGKERENVKVNEDSQPINKDHSVEKRKNYYMSYMMRIRDQGNCGSCWAFSALGAIEGYWNLKNPNNFLPDYLSPQQLLDCDKWDGGCDGGWFDGAMTYLQRNYAMFEEDYPYKALTGRKCLYKKNEASRIRLKGFNYSININYSDNSNYQTFIKNGPYAVAVDATDDWLYYESGVFDGPCSADINHGVVVAAKLKGNNGEVVYRIRNSWGEDWGEDGYIDILQNPDNNQTCDVESYAYQPTGFR